MTLSANDFAFLRDLLDREAGIVLEPGKEYLCESRLAPVARRLGLSDIPALVGALQERRPDARAAVIDAMTTNETSFFRDDAVWRGLSTVVLPELLERRRRTRRLDIWSGACSSGQELYTLAMVLVELLGDELPSWRIGIVGTDLSSEMVARAREGIYNEFELGRGLSAERRRRFLEQRPDGFVVGEPLRRLVQVRQMNLLTSPWSLRGPFDLVLLRNVLIYFAPSTRLSVLERIAEVMAPDAHLLLGASEGAMRVPPVFRPWRAGGLSGFRLGDPPAVPAPTVPSSLTASAAGPAPIHRTDDAVVPTPVALRPETLSLLRRLQSQADGSAHPSGQPAVQPAAQPSESPETALDRLRALRRAHQG